MYLDRPANRLQSPSGFLSSEQVPPLSLLHMGASTPGFYAKSRCFVFFETFTRLSVSWGCSKFSDFYFFMKAMCNFVRKNSCAETNVSIIVQSIYPWKTIFIITQWQHIMSQVFDAKFMSINPRDTPSKPYVSIIVPRQFYSPFYSLSFAKDSLGLKLNVTS